MYKRFVNGNISYIGVLLLCYYAYCIYVKNSRISPAAATNTSRGFSNSITTCNNNIIKKKKKKKKNVFPLLPPNVAAPPEGVWNVLVYKSTESRTTRYARCTSVIPR